MSLEKKIMIHGERAKKLGYDYKTDQKIYTNRRRQAESCYTSQYLTVEQCLPFFTNPNDKLSFIKLCTAVGRDQLFHIMASRETITDRWNELRRALNNSLLELYNEFLSEHPDFKPADEYNLTIEAARLNLCDRIISDLQGRRYKKRKFLR